MLRQHINEMTWLRERLQQGLSTLLVSDRYAQLDGVDGERFAVSADELAEQGLTRCDLNWLVTQSFVVHLVELTSPNDLERSFRVGGATISASSCFFLTVSGVKFALELASANSVPVQGVHLQTTTASADKKAAAIPPGPPISEADLPRWDEMRHELWFGVELVKRYRLPSPNQTAILSAFQEESWPARIDDPLPPKVDQDPKRRLHDTIRNLNRSHRRSLLRFSGDGSGQGVIWEVSR